MTKQEFRRITGRFTPLGLILIAPFAVFFILLGELVISISSALYRAFVKP